MLLKVKQPLVSKKRVTVSVTARSNLQYFDNFQVHHSVRTSDHPKSINMKISFANRNENLGGLNMIYKRAVSSGTDHTGT